jgi:hypothetical protein
MIGHPSGDEPLMVDVRQNGSGSEFDYRGRGEPFVARLGGVLEAHGGDDVVAVLIQPLGALQQERRVVPGNPQLAVWRPLYSVGRGHGPDDRSESAFWA